MASSGKVIWSFLRLIRVKNLLIIGGTQFLVYYSLILSYGIPVALKPSLFSLLVLSIVLLAAAGYVINDYMDIKADEINKGDVIVGKVIKRRAAIIWHLTLTAVGLALGVFTSYNVGQYYLVGIHLFYAFILWYYSSHLKRQFLVGNIVVSFCIGLSVIAVPLFTMIPALNEQYSANQRSLFLIISGYAFFAFLINLIREIIKDLQDVPGDSAQGFRTMAIQVGETGTKVILSSLIAAMLVLVGMVSYKLLRNDIGPLIYTILLVIVPSVLLLYQVVTAENPNDYGRASTLTKIIMLFGILSMWAFNQLASL